MPKQNTKAGYYTVLIREQDKRIPYTVFATSDYHAARLIQVETGYLAGQLDVSGPHARI